MQLGPNPLPTVGDTNGTWGQLLNTYLAAIPQDVADTGIAGFVLQNGTPTILTWTAPNDGNQHIAIFVAALSVTTAETGGQVNFNITNGAGAVSNALFNGGNGVGALNTSTIRLISPGQTASIVQQSALTAGAATLYAQIWAA